MVVCPPLAGESDASLNLVDDEANVVLWKKGRRMRMWLERMGNKQDGALSVRRFSELKKVNAKNGLQ